MTYMTGDIPIGAYDSSRLSNLGIGHGALDGGGGYTYFNPQTGHEFSAVLGFTYNFENRSTQYPNGVDMHLDWGASQFLTKQVQIGLVGYVYKELGCDSGSARRDAGLSQFQRLQGICRGEPARWLEYVGHLRDLAGGADSLATAAHGHEIADLKRPRRIYHPR